MPLVKVAPSLTAGHEITVVHEVCGVTQTSDPKTVQPLANAGIGEVAEPLYDGDTSVTVKDVTAGAYVEIWDQDKKLTSGFAPFSDTGKVNVAFDVPGGLKAGQHIHAKFWHCGLFGRNEGRPVVYRKPELHQVQPATVAAGGSDLTIGAIGLYFRPGAMIWFSGAGLVTTTFISTTEVRATIPAYHVAHPATKQVQVRNPDGQVTQTKTIEIVAPSPPPPQPQPGFSKVSLHNCNTSKRSVRIYKRDVTLGQPFQFVQVMEHEYDDWGTCPSGVDPLEIELTDGHYTEIVAVDPENIGCLAIGEDPSAASPLTIACRRDALLLLGKTGGPVLNYTLA